MKELKSSWRKLSPILRFAVVFVLVFQFSVFIFLHIIDYEPTLQMATFLMVVAFILFLLAGVLFILLGFVAKKEGRVEFGNAIIAGIVIILLILGFRFGIFMKMLELIVGL